ncbi:MAG: hypothetical protein IJ640_09140, partial [Prevotella sp.]|nr:hypothetical protein [Prevotella sp.]
RRKTDNAQYKMEKDESNIIEGLPLVNEIPQRLEYHIQSFAKYAVPATVFPCFRMPSLSMQQGLTISVS